MKNAAHSAMPAPAVMMKLGVADHIAQVVKVASFRDRHVHAALSAAWRLRRAPSACDNCSRAEPCFKLGTNPVLQYAAWQSG